MMMDGEYAEGLASLGADNLGNSLVRSAGVGRHLAPLLRDMAADMIAELAAPPARRHMTACPQIRTRAYLLWEQAGCPEGRALDFWLTAENEFSQGIAHNASAFESRFTGWDPISP